MNKRRIYLAVLIIFLLTILSSSVYAQNMFDTVLSPFEKINIGAIYEDHWYIVDCVMYFIILVGVSQFVFSQQFSGKGGKAIIIGMGVSLAVAASYFEYKNKFMLMAAFGPIAVIIVVVLFLVGIYKLAQTLGAGGKGFAMLAFAFLFFYITAMLPELAKWFYNNTNEFIRLIWALLNILAIIFLIWGIIDIISSLAKLGGGGGGGEGPGLLDRLRGREPRERAERRQRGEGEGPGEAPGGGEREGERFDYDNPATVTVLVTDIDDVPIKGAVVTITGPKSGWPRHWLGWRRRGPYYTGKTGPDGRIPPIRVPAGNLRFEARHPGFEFSDLGREGRRFTTTYWIVKPAEEIEIQMRLRRIEREPEPEVMAIDPQERGVFFHGRFN